MSRKALPRRSLAGFDSQRGANSPEMDVKINIMTKVTNFLGKTGKTVANQFIITEPDKVIFQSYNSVIAVKMHDGAIILGKNWDFSTTTGKYRNIFLNETKADTVSKIKSGIYTIDNTL